MASSRTQLTELGTAVGLFYEPADPWPQSVEQLDLPGIASSVWQPVVLPVTTTAHPSRDLLLRAMSNGLEFRRHVLGGRRPMSIEWTGGARSPWVADIPRDLTIDSVYFIQAKYESTCVLNTSPSALVDHLLVEDGAGNHESWFEQVALDDLQRYYRSVRGHAPFEDLPVDVRALDASHRAALKTWMRSTSATEAQNRSYLDLCRAVSVETELRWQHRLRASSPAQHTHMLFRMLRIAGGPYWVLGTKGTTPVRLAVTDTRTWRERFSLRRFTVRAAGAGQPQVDWRAIVRDAETGLDRQVDGCCEIRWSHGKLQGHPECKVQVITPLDQLPGYDPLA